MEAASTTKLSYEEISDAYRKDLLENYSFTLCKEELPIGQIVFSSTSKNFFADARFDVYAGFTNTIEALKKYEVFVPAEYDISKIDSVTVYNYYSGYDVESMTQEERDKLIANQVKVTYTDKKQIQQILDSMFNYSFPGEWYNHGTYFSPQYSIDVNSGRTVYGGYGNGFFSFKPGEVPEFVVKDTNK